jgi:Luciferase-like monooxygenase
VRVVYRHPGILLKAVTTLDVLSAGRIDVAAGAGWDVEEVTTPGIPFPSKAARFEHREDVLRIAHRMWSGDESPFEGVHHRLARPLNSPAAWQRPHPPILVAGGGERKTPRRRRVRRRVQPGRPACALRGTSPAGGRSALLARIGELAAMGVEHVIVMAPSFEGSGNALDTVCGLVDDVHAIIPAA